MHIGASGIERVNKVLAQVAPTHLQYAPPPAHSGAAALHQGGGGDALPLVQQVHVALVTHAVQLVVVVRQLGLVCGAATAHHLE